MISNLIVSKLLRGDCVEDNLVVNCALWGVSCFEFCLHAKLNDTKAFTMLVEHFEHVLLKLLCRCFFSCETVKASKEDTVSLGISRILF
jgi:hypothetical protein